MSRNTVFRYPSPLASVVNRGLRLRLPVDSVRTSTRAIQSYSDPVEMSCADCGCLVERGVRISLCGKPECCCLEFPTRASPETLAEKIQAAFDQPFQDHDL